MFDILVIRYSGYSIFWIFNILDIQCSGCLIFWLFDILDIQYFGHSIVWIFNIHPFYHHNRRSLKRWRQPFSSVGGENRTSKPRSWSGALFSKDRYGLLLLVLLILPLILLLLVLLLIVLLLLILIHQAGVHWWRLVNE